MSPTVCIAALRAPLFAAAVSTGRPIPDLCAEVGVLPTLVLDGAARVPHELVTRAWDTLARAAADDHLGVFAAKLSEGAPRTFLDYALRHHSTVGAASAAFARWQRLFHEANDGFSEPTGTGDVALVQRFAGDPPTSRHLREFILGMWVTHLRRWTGTPLAPVAVSFRHPPPEDPEPARQFFGVAPSYRSDRDSLVVSAALLDLPIVGAEPPLLEMFGRQVEQDSTKLFGDAAVIERVRAEIVRRLSTGTAELPAVARSLSLGARTLQRRLGELGTSYQAILDEERRKVALERIGGIDATVTDVAFLLGFSDTSAFARAFRRWTGTTPSEFRRAGAA